MTTASKVLAALQLDGCEIVETLPPNWHGDGHWRVRDARGHEYSVRAIGTGRPMRVEEARPYGTRTVLAQLEVAAALPRAGVPMMPLERGPVALDDGVALAFGWLDGEIAAVADPARAFAIGGLLAQLHGAALPEHEALPVHDARVAAMATLPRLRGVVDESFRERAAAIVERCSTTAPARAVSHGDCNFANVLWRGAAVVGLVDLDQIGFIDPLEELAYAVKCWSRPRGIAVHEHDRALAANVLEGYGLPIDRAVLADLLWITGCLNANSVNHLFDAPPHDRATVVAHLESRADMLAGLAR